MSDVMHGEVVESNQIVRRDDAPVYAPIVPRVDVRVRVGTSADLAFIDRLQKAHSRELGFLPTAALEGKIGLGQVLVAEAGEREDVKREDVKPGQCEPSSRFTCSRFTKPIGYIIAADRYFKRDEIGYITQINVVKEFRRSLVAGMLLQAQFDRSAYGCRLYCCWCAQDLVANEFWEAMGFTAIAFRTGSRTKGKRGGKRGPRIHIFWQKRIREGDGDASNGGAGAGATPWWYPSTTGGGEMREDRLVFPIPPGVSWRDVLPVVLAGESEDGGLRMEDGAADREGRALSSILHPRSSGRTSKPRAKKVVRGPKIKGGFWFRRNAVVQTVEEPAKDEVKPKAKIDPRLIAMARELRDRWSERAELILPAPAKHDVRRMIAPPPPPTGEMHQIPARLALPAAA